MAYVKTEWKDRQVQYPNRYTDETGKIYTFTRAPGDIIEPGTIINAMKLNNIENGIESLGTEFERKTYSELKTLKDNSQLQEGKRYLLTDYRTKYQQPGTNVIKEMGVEELILTASSVNTFEPIVYSPSYPQDTIWFDFNNNICEDNINPRNGFITRRYDHISGNDCPQDWRTMLWARWKPDVNQYYKNGVLTNYSIWTSGNAQMGVIYKSNNQLLVAKNAFQPANANDINIFEIIYNDITIGRLEDDKTTVWNITGDLLELKKGELHERLTFNGNNVRNIVKEVGKTLHKNVFEIRCSSNYLACNCFGNNFDENCNNNIFASGCNGNVLGKNCSDNSFGNDCGGNSFGNSCYNNTFGKNCGGNSFGSDCYINTFSNNCVDNKFSFSAHYLFIKRLNNKNLMHLNLYNSGYNTNIYQNEGGNYVYWYLDANNQPIYHQIP